MLFVIIRLYNYYVKPSSKGFYGKTRQG